MPESRTKKAIKNSTVSLLCQLIGVIVSFGSRTVFTFLLGSEYLGISGLFTNILTILSFAELGFGSAIVYRLYAPLANDDHNTVRLYMRLYKKIYVVVALIITALGIAVIPFLGYIVDSPAVVEDVRLLYCLYLLHTVVSYVCVYKKSLLIADQNSYIVSFVSQIVAIAMHITQIIILLITHNFVFYCILLSVFVLVENLVCSYIANKKYTYLREKTVGKLPADDINGLKKDVKGLMFTNVAATVLTGTDNLFISFYIGIAAVGILSNYSLILTTVNGVMNMVFASLTAIVGNLAVKEDHSQTEETLKRMYFLNAAIYCLICTGMLVLVKEFVTSIWLTQEYTLPTLVVTVAILELFFRSLHFPLHTVQMALGLFSQYRFMYIVAAATNIILDFILVQPMGIAGLIIATILSRFIIFFTDIYVVYRFGFKKRSTNYVLMILKWVLFMAICTIVSALAVSFITSPGILWFIVRVLVVIAIYAIMFLLIFFRSSEFLYYKDITKRLFKKGKI